MSHRFLFPSTRNSLLFTLLISVFLPSCKTTFNHLESSQSKQVSTSIQVTEGTNMAATLSPDGTQIVIDLQGALWTIPVTGGKAKAISESLGDARQPSWAPNGQNLCFQGYWEGNWHIYIVDKTGTNLKQLTTGRFDHREADWSPDGKSISFSSDRSGNYDIWSISVLDNNMTQLTSDDFEEFGPKYNHDGSKILYARKEGQETFIQEIQLSDSKIRSLYSSDFPIAGLTYSPDDSKIYYNEVKESRSALFEYSLYLDKTSPVQITEDNEDVFPFKINWVSEEEILYTSSGKIKIKNILDKSTRTVPFAASLNLGLKEKNYKRKVRDFDFIGTQSVKGIYQPCIAPNGKSIAFIALGDLWIQYKNQIPTRITTDHNIQLAPAWSKDSKLLAYASDISEQTAIWIYNTEKDVHTEVGTTAGLTSGIDWLDQHSLIYTLNYGPRNGSLWHIDVTTGQSKKIGKSYPYSISSPSISPNGQWIATSILAPYSKLYREGINKIIYTSRDGSKVINAQTNEHASFGMRGNDGPKYSPRGDQLAYISKGYLWVARINETGSFTSTPIQLTSELSGTPSWLSDGMHLCYQTPSKVKVINIDTKKTEEFQVNLTWSTAKNSKTIAIKAGAIFNGIDSQLILNHDIVIQGHRISSIEPHDPSRIVDQWIDAQNKYVIPGLIDIHAHQGSTDGVNLGKKWLAWGVTSTRDPATNPFDALNRKEATQSGNYVGPRIFFTGSPLDGSRVYYSGTYALYDKNQLALELDRSHQLDYDFIKTYVRLSDPLQKEIVKKAHDYGLPVYSHELYPASSFGVDGVEHILGTSRRGYNTKMSNTFKSYSDVTTLIAKSKMSFTPTIGIYVGYDYLLAEDPSVLEDKRIKALEPSWVINAGLEAVKKVNKNLELWSINFKNAAQMIKDIHDKGGLVVAGTDGPILPFGFGLHMELACYQRAGLTAFEVLQTTTINAAKVLGASSDLGSLEPGKLADLLILNSNPLSDIRNAKDIDGIMINGALIKLSSLLDKN